MGKLTVFTTITPLPSNVPRQLALDMLHAHAEVIELNPLVTGVKAIEAPRDASSDEYFSQWYEISEIITWGFGLKKKLSFKGVFHDQPWGLQTHVYAPLGVDLRNKYRIGGNQPGEPREVRELGIETPLDGLYLRNDVEITCNAAIASFVKKETKQAINVMIDRMARKAELLDDGKLHAMFENGRLKTNRPLTTLEDNPNTVVASPGGSPAAFQPSPAAQYRTSPMLQPAGSSSPALDQRGFGNYHEVSRQASQHHHSNSSVSGHSPHLSAQYPAHGYSPQMGHQYPAYGGQPSGGHFVTEMPDTGSYYPKDHKAQSQSFTAELPGDSSYMPAPLKVQQPVQQQQLQQQPQQPQQPPHSPQPTARQLYQTPAQFQQPIPQQQQSIQQQPLDSKPPVQYKAYTPPPREQQQQQPPAQRKSISSQARESQASTTSAAPSTVATRTHSNASSIYSVSTPLTATSTSTSPPIHQQQQQQQQQQQPLQQRNSSTQEPDHSRFASLSIGSSSTPPPPSSSNPSIIPKSSSPPPNVGVGGIGGVGSALPPPPRKTPGTASPPAGGRAPQSQPLPLALQGRNVKCPACGLFEGDEEAVSHHVSVAHFA